MNTQNSGKDNQLEPLSLVILIVDDDELVRKTIDRILTKHGHETAMASDGQAALKLVAEKSFDIALLDYNLPDTNGIELVTKIKEMAPSVLSLIVTGFGTIERAVEAMQAGAWDFITKPITSG
ncbi:response regulator, partial [bacterium]|nr:response regulator [bacterium]